MWQIICGPATVQYIVEVNFIRTIHDWELESTSTFFDLLYSAEVNGHGEDKLSWKPATPKGFEVRLYYQALALCGGNFLWKSIWHAKIPPRVAFFTWTASLENIITADNLTRQKIILVSWYV